MTFPQYRNPQRKQIFTHFSLSRYPLGSLSIQKIFSHTPNQNNKNTKTIQIQKTTQHNTITTSNQHQQQ